MQYNSWLYLFPFLGGSLILYYLLPIKRRWIGLLFSSLLFYIPTMKSLVVVVLFTTAAIYLGARVIEQFNETFKLKKKELDRAARKELKNKTTTKIRYVIAFLCFINFGILFVTKYFNFFGENINALFNALHIPAQIPFLNIFLPLGISFYTLSAISYVTDVARGVCKVERNYLRLLLFLIFFPVITEGPISRYGQLGEELKAEHRFDYKQFCFGAQLITWGLFQKVLLSDRVNMYVRAIFANHERYSGFPVIMAILLYTFQLYMDFAGCINIARGSAQLFGITLEENFKRPFFATSVNDFWRRWHITLGAWFKDYIFYPISLGTHFQKFSQKCRAHMNRYYAATIPGIFALFAVWFGNGIWHGAEWKYIIYGLYYYVIMVLGMLLEPVFAAFCRKCNINRNASWYHIMQTARTFILVNIGMLIFRARNLNVAIAMLCSVFRPWNSKVSFWQIAFDQGGLFKLDFLLIIFSIILLYLIGKSQEEGHSIRELISKQSLPIRWGLYMIPIILIIIAGAYGPGWGVADFIYAKF